MNRAVETISHRAKAARILALQPPMRLEYLCEPVMSTEEPLILGNIATLIQLWARQQPDLPDEVGERLQVKSVSRQPLAFITVELEIVSRRLESVDVPFAPDDRCDSSTWKTEDIFALHPVAEPSFPASAKEQWIDVPGREEVRSCDSCDGAGAIECRACNATGTVLCPGCAGVHRYNCPSCGGSGQQLSVSGRYIQCRGCVGRGILTCTRCDATGRISCPRCHGQGHILCQPCGGHGNVKTCWQIENTTATRQAHRMILRQEWPLPAQELLEEADIVAEVIWPWPGDVASAPLEELGDDMLRWETRSLLKEALFELPDLQPERQRITAARIRLLGAYAYEVEVDCGGEAYGLRIAGTGNRIYAENLPRRSRGPVAAVGRMLRRYFRALGSDDAAGLDPQFAAAVSSGRAHLADSRCLIPEIALQQQWQCEVTAEGYLLYVIDRQAGENSRDVAFNIAIESDSQGGVILTAAHALGPVRREKLPEALAMCHDLLFGRLAVREEQGGEILVLIDRRPYALASAESYVLILSTLAADARRLQSSKLSEGYCDGHPHP